MKENGLPSFLGIGTAKAGTTTLHDLLMQHPAICMPHTQKEIGFFDNEENFEKGLEWYQTCFHPVSETQIQGEITPQYISSDKAPERIRDSLGTDTRFLVVLREPVARAFSHYLHMRQRGAETRSFEQAVQDEEARAFSFSDEREKNSYGYITRSLYHRQLERWFRLFPPENFLILIFEEDILKNQEATWHRLLKHLNVPVIPLPDIMHSNQTYEPRFLFLNAFILKMWRVIGPVVKPFFPNREGRQKLWHLVMASRKKPGLRLEEKARKAYYDRFFVQDVARLETLIQKDLSLWHK